MKKTLLFTIFALFSLLSHAQVKIGLNFSPALAFSRLTYEKEPVGVSYDAKGVGLRFIAGPEISFYFGDNVAFTTGAWYAIKRAAINTATTNVLVNPPTVTTMDHTYNLQYIQLPATLKLFTNEVATDMKVYFQLGGTFDIKIDEKEKGTKVKTGSVFKPFDTSILFGSGIELQMGESTYFLAGLRYTRGLLNTVKSPLSDDINIKNSLLSLDFGIRF
jgi:hypothetical protein